MNSNHENTLSFLLHSKLQRLFSPLYSFNLHLVPPVVVGGACGDAAEVSYYRSPQNPRPQQRELGHQLACPGHQAEGCGGRTVDGSGVCWARNDCL